jgi:hypothetical protein
VDEDFMTNTKIISLATLANDIQRLLTDPNGSDCKIKTNDGRTFKVHKAILASNKRIKISYI